jgi:ribose transport system substrate-binding protein
MNRGKRSVPRWLQAIGIGVAVAALAACSTPAAPSDDDPKAQRIGIVGFSDAVAQSNDILGAIGTGAEAEGWTYDFQNANPAGDAASANQLMQVMIQKGATVLVVAYFDPDQLATGIAAAKAANVPVLAMTAGKLSDGVAWASDIGYVPAMGDLIKENYKDSTKVEILNLTYLPATPGQGRNRLLQDVAKEDSKFVLTDKDVPIPGAVQGGRDFTTAWLATHPETPGVDLMIYAAFDQPAEGAVAALKQAGRTDVKIYSYDSSPAGLALMKEGYIVADIWNGPEQQSAQVLQAVKDVLSGKYTAETPQLDPVAFTLVTTETLADFEAEHPEAFISAE